MHPLLKYSYFNFNHFPKDKKPNPFDVILLFSESHYFYQFQDRSIWQASFPQLSTPDLHLPNFDCLKSLRILHKSSFIVMPPINSFSFFTFSLVSLTAKFFVSFSLLPAWTPMMKVFPFSFFMMGLPLCPLKVGIL